MLFVKDYLTDQLILRASSSSPVPRVSIILPTYHRCQNGFLARAITSVLAQTFTDFELIVMDDGSTDGSYDLIQDFQARDPRVVHVRHERNCGLPGLRCNEGIELARGEYLAFQFDDDCWRPNALQDLLAGAARQAAPAVVVGHAQFKGQSSEWKLPAVELNIVNLYEQNRFANNSVLFPRHLTEKYGMYDCHIGMRRLCDWDLWLRYIKHVPFITIDETIADVFESNPDSIGLTVPCDLPLFRYFHDIPRDHLLTPARWRDYEVDSLRVGEVEIEKDFRRRLYELHIAPYYFKFRHHFPALEGFAATLPTQSKTVLYTKNSYDVSNDVTLNHYDALANRRGHYKNYFQLLPQVNEDWTREADMLLLVRTVEDQSEGLLKQAQANNIPVGYYLDDDLLTFHEYGPQFDYLAPGTPYHRNLSSALSQADAVLMTNQFLAESVQPLNPRVIPHNNAIPKTQLPADIRPRDHRQPLRIGYVGSGYRLEEFTQIWEALQRLAREYGERLSFEFWGLDVSSLPTLNSPVRQKPFTFSYFHYLSQLADTGFDILLTPLLDHPRPRLAKSLIKYYETAVAGALGIFSDVPQYEKLPADLTCLKAANTAEGWYQALRQAITMEPAQLDLMRRRCLAHVREEYTETAQIHLHEAALRAVEFHAHTRATRYSDGRPRVIYVLHSAHFGGGEIQLWRRLRLARSYGIEPIIVLPSVLRGTETAERMTEALTREHFQVEFIEYTCFDRPRSPAEFCSELERNAIRTLLKRCRPALVHSVTFVASFGQICQELGIPHVASMYALDDEFAWANGQPGFTHAAVTQSDSVRYARRWSQLVGGEQFCSREVAPLEIFDLGLKRHLTSLAPPAERKTERLRLAVTGTFQERKRQLETIEAVGRLAQAGLDCQLNLYGYTHFFPAYMQQCYECIETYNIADRVTIHDFTTNIAGVLEVTDVILSLSTFESFPSAIKEAMSGGALVVATPVGGIPELVIDGVSGILCTGTDVDALVEGIRRAILLPPQERERIVEQARRVARSEFHPQRVANDLLFMYNRALELTHAPIPNAYSEPHETARYETVIKSPPPAPVALANVSVPPLEAKISPPPPVSPDVVPVVAVEMPAAPDPVMERISEDVLPSPVLRLPAEHGMQYQIVPQRVNWQGLDIMSENDNGRIEGQLILRVLTPSHQLVRESAVSLTGARETGWLNFRFAPIANSSHQRFILEFNLADATATTTNNLPDTKPSVRAYWRRKLRLLGNSLQCRLRYDG